MNLQRKNASSREYFPPAIGMQGALHLILPTTPKNYSRLLASARAGKARR
jgi:hypothetical protein